VILIAAIHHQHRARRELHLLRHFHVCSFAVAGQRALRQVSLVIQHQVQLHCALGLHVLPSVITSNPATCDHFKSGQRSRTQDMKLFYLAGAGSGRFCFVSL
jgi:hypothetical protein